MLVRTIIIAVWASLVVHSSAQAVEIGNFPGLQKLIDRSDAIVILRIRAPVDTQPSPTLYTTHDCLIRQSLKGDLPEGKTIRLQLMDTRHSSYATTFATGSTHLIFLTKKRNPDEPTDYRSIEIEGANIRLSHQGHEKPPEGKNLEERVRNVVRESIKYLDSEYEREQRFRNTFISK